MSAAVLKESLHASDLKYHLHPQTELGQHQIQGPHIFTEGDGIYVSDIDGKQYIEGLAGLWCTTLGFSESRLADAADNQLRTLPFYHNFAHRTTPVAVELAERLVNIAPESLSKVFFTNSGSEANDTMVKMVWYYNNVKGRTNKKTIISREGAYHGITLAASSLTGMAYAHTFFDVLTDNFRHTSCPHYYHGADEGESEEDYASRLVDELEAVIKKEGADQIAAFIAEPVIGAGGVIPPPKSYFEKVQKLLKRHDILFVADEVICGFGRTGNMFGSDTYDIQPDIMVVAKGLSSGYIPIGGVLVSDAIFETLVDGSQQVGTFGTGFTYSGHPVPCAVALETLKIYEERNIAERTQELSPHFLKRLHDFQTHPLVGECRGIGLIGAIELVKDKESRENFDPALKVAAQVVGLALEEGLIVRPLRNDTVAFCPPLIISPAEIDEMFDRFARAMDKAKHAIKLGKTGAMAAKWRLGVDIGGTFTDVIALHTKTEEQRVAKVRSHKGKPLSSLLEGMKAVQLDWDDVDELIHGTTMVTNAIVEEKFNSVALIATEGFSDSIEIGRQNRLHLYRLDLPPKLLPQVSRDLRFELRERLDYKGQVLENLCDKSVKEVSEQVQQAEVDAVAVSLMHAYANPDHEVRLAKTLSQSVSNIALSHEVNPEAREYERTSTTVLSASIMKPVSTYLDQIEESKPEDKALYFFHSAGGMVSPDVVRRLPLSLAFSGPAAGVAAAAQVTRQLKLDHAISFDMGGTTTDVCMISHGQAEISSQRSLGGRPLRMPMVAVESIGAGGGSIASLDTGVLRVGPESVGAEPGPACYGRGGELPTVTDADLVLGYLTPDNQLGDGTILDPLAAEATLKPVAEEIGISIHELALGILDVANANMVRALQKISVERGIDGRQCALLAFGGAGPIHAVKLARAFEMTTVIVPNHSSIFSAFGCATGEKSLSQQQTVRMSSTNWDFQELEGIRNNMVHGLLSAFQDTDPDSVQYNDVVAIRYVGQSYSIEINEPTLSDPDTLGLRFKSLHEKLYGFATDEAWELESLRVRASVPIKRVEAQIKPCHQTKLSSRKITAPCWFKSSGAVPTPRYHRENLFPRTVIEGPAIIEDLWSTIVLPPKTRLEVDSHLNLVIDVEVWI